jgi:hypothetical protein
VFLADRGLLASLLLLAGGLLFLPDGTSLLREARASCRCSAVVARLVSGDNWLQAEAICGRSRRLLLRAFRRDARGKGEDVRRGAHTAATDSLTARVGECEAARCREVAWQRSSRVCSIAQAAMQDGWNEG